MTWFIQTSVCVLLSQSFSARPDCSKQISVILLARTRRVAVSCLRGNNLVIWSICLRVYVQVASPAAGGFGAPVTHEMFFIAGTHSWLLPGAQVEASEDPLVPVFPWWSLPSWGVLRACQLSARVPTFNLADLWKILQTSGSHCSPVFVMQPWLYYLFNFHSC